MDATLPLAGDGRLISLPSLALWWSFARHRCDTFAGATRHQYRPPFSLVNGRLQNTWSAQHASSWRTRDPRSPRSDGRGESDRRHDPPLDASARPWGRIRPAHHTREQTGSPGAGSRGHVDEFPTARAATDASFPNRLTNWHASRTLDVTL